MACEAISHVGQDRIGALPDGILSHILSHLPTRDAVQTTILSKRWNNLWISVPNLDLDAYVLGDKFEEFVDGVLSLHASSNVQKLRLRISDGYYCDRDNEKSRNHRWICDAMMHNIIELDLAVYGDYYYGMGELPLSLFTCKTLVALKVDTNCMDFAPPPSAAACFPALKSLDYGLIRPNSASMLAILVSKCPVLEDLTIDTYIFIEDVNTLNILAPGLKTFRMLGHDQDKPRSIFINAPKLENLVVTGEAGLSNYYFSNNGNSLVKAQIHLTYYDYTWADLKERVYSVERAPPLLEGVSRVKYLSLSTPRFSAHSLPSFHNLEHLDIELSLCSYWEYLMELLKRSPKLEHIVLNICPWSWDQHNYEKGYRPFSPPEVVPICVSSHLKTISIKNFMGYDDEFEVVEYLLKCSTEVLRRLTISTHERYLFRSRRMKPEKLHKKALKFQKCSATCEIEIIINDGPEYLHVP